MFSRQMNGLSSDVVPSAWASRSFGPTTSPNDPFGSISDYPACAGCGGFHAVFDPPSDPQGFALSADDRGGVTNNGKPSLTPGEAGFQLTRGLTGWNTSGTLGQPLVITYAFRSTAPGTMPEETSGFSRFTDLQIAATLQALASWSDVANITFQRVGTGVGEGAYSNDATMLFGNYSSGAAGSAAFAFLPGNRAVGSNSGDVWINNSLGYNASPAMLGYGVHVLTHEIGHALGLRHPADYNAEEGVSITYSANATYFEDSRQYTVMSYFGEQNTGGNFRGSNGIANYSAVPLMDDIAAVQRLYGANMNTRTGDTVYGFNSNAGQPWLSAVNAQSTLIFTVWDAGGNDTFDFSGYTQSQVIDLRQGSFSNVGGLVGNVSIALGAVIENAIGGSGNDRIIGNSGDNVIVGGGGTDNINGGLGVDTVVFSGNRADYNVFWVGNIGYVSGPGTYTILSNVEFLKFADQTIAAAPTGGLAVSGDVLNNVMEGSSFADTLLGMGGDDVLYGFGGDDQLSGGTGNDRLFGGDGNDWLDGGSGDDLLDGGAGIDTANYGGARGAVNVDLGTGVATGGGGNDRLVSIENVIGSTFNDRIVGDAGDNRIEGRGGADVLIGGAGNDTLIAGEPGTVGGAPDVVKTAATVNATQASAVNLDRHFDLQPRAGVEGSPSVPSATVLGTGHGGVEYYAFTVKAGDVVRLDIDNAGFDATLRLFDAAGNEIAQNDDRPTNGADAGNATDSLLTHTFTTSGTYYVQVGQWTTNGPGNGGFTSGGVPAGATYQLNVSVPSATPVPTFLQGSVLDGGSGNDILYGGSGDDTLIGGAGSDQLFGGAGFDTAVYSGVRLQYQASSGAISGGPEGGRDTLSGIEQARFVDGILTFDENSTSAITMRLYSAALNRQPDQQGLETNARLIADARLSVVDLANAFVNSGEFQQRYGALADRAFVEQLYRFALGREGDEPGIANWVGVLQSGGNRGQVLLGFSESAEHRGLTAPTLANGLWVPDDVALFVARLYNASFKRLPDVDGLSGWVDAVKGGMDIATVAGAFAGSAEFQLRFGSLSNQAFVEQLYRFCLGREADGPGLSSWVGLLDAGRSRAEILIGFSESGEHRALTASSWAGGIQFEGYRAAGVEKAEVLTIPLAEEDVDVFVMPVWSDDGRAVPMSINELFDPSAIDFEWTGLAAPVGRDLDGFWLRAFDERLDPASWDRSIELKLDVVTERPGVEDWWN